MFETLKKNYEEGIKLAKENLGKDSFAYINQHQKLKLRKEDALIIPDSTRELRKLIESEMPTVRIEQLVSEVDKRENFLKFFVPPEGFVSQRPFDKPSFYAALIAQGTNIGLDGMAKSTLGITVETLKHISQWYIYPAAIEMGNAHLIDIHSQHPLSKIYGDGSRSSSDADRFIIQKSSNLAAFYPRFYGYYRKVIGIYTHVSDQHSVFGTQVISCGLREATFVLDGLLQNISTLTPRHHSTDTNGFTHYIFALSYLLGFSFQPRLKDLPNQKLYRLNKTDNYGDIDVIFKGSISLALIDEQWDYLVRIAASLKKHAAPAHIIIQRLSSRSRTDRVVKALQHLGKLIKTIYILHYISKQELRQAVQKQLNRGESRHYLAKHLFFANQGEFKTNDYEEMMNIASCLSFLSNAVLLWNTPKIYSIINKLRAGGMSIDDEDIARISPLLFRHLIVHGMYDFRLL
jgi:TnpA family transposase